MIKRALLGVALTLALAGGVAHAQDTGTVPGGTTPPGATTGLPFVNDGANQPVLQPISPGAAPLDAPVLEGSAPHEAAADGAHEGRKGLPQFDTSLFARQIFWLAIVFVALFFVFSKSTLPAIGRTLDKRENRIATDLNQAENLKHEVERVRGEYEAAIAKAQGDGQKMVQDLQADVKADMEARDAAFKTRAEEATGQLEFRINADRVRVGTELEAMAAELAASITSVVTGVTPDAASARRAVDVQTGKMEAA